MDPRDLPQDWPFRNDGLQIRNGPHRWWLLDLGPRDAPTLLLLHGLGASSHSFRHLIPHLSNGYRLIVPDLPGQGCTQTSARHRIALAPVAEDLWSLCAARGAEPIAVVGHSAGGAIALQMALNRPGLGAIGINAALGHFEGAAGLLFPLLAQALSGMPFAATGFARLWGNARTVDRLLAGTGSQIEPEGRAQYLHLVRDPAHVRGALDMMANWKLDPLLAALPRISAPVLLLAGDGDRAVPPQLSREAATRIPGASYSALNGGHLLHEECAAAVAQSVTGWLHSAGLSSKII